MYNYLLSFILVALLIKLVLLSHTVIFPAFWFRVGVRNAQGSRARSHATPFLSPPALGLSHPG